MINKKAVFSLVFAASFSFSPVSSFACTRLLHVDKNQGVMVGRNMDWFEGMQAKLVVFPRGIARNGFANVNPIKWVSKYGSIVTTSYDVASADGMNEAGLAIHGLWLEASDYGQRNENIPGLSVMMASLYYLDNFKTVDEAVHATQSNAFQMLPFYFPKTKQWIKVHIAIEDANGDSAIIEYINGEPKIYHSNAYTVLTNDPTYDLQLENLKQYESFGGKKLIPGTDDPSARFVRATYHGNHLPAFATPREEVAGIFSVMQNVGAPYSVFKKNPAKIHRTLWRTVSDLTHHVYYFNSSRNLTTVYVNLDKFSLRAGSPIMKLDLVKHPELSGDVTDKFQAIKN